MDCGVRIILHSDWLQYPGEMTTKNCYSVSSADELVALLTVCPMADFSAAYEEILHNASPYALGQSWLDVLG